MLLTHTYLYLHVYIHVYVHAYTGVLRIPFIEPVTARKGVKEAIVSLSQLVAAKKKELKELSQ